MYALRPMLGTALFTGFTSIMVLLPEATNHALALIPTALGEGDWWRLITGHFVHFSPQHAWLNALIFLITGAMVEREIGSVKFSVVIVIFSVSISAGLLFWSHMLLEYRGLSGLAVALTVGALFLAAQANRAAKFYVAALAALLSLKLINEAFGIISTTANLPAGIVVEWRAHALGAAAGIILVLILKLRIKK